MDSILKFIHDNPAVFAAILFGAVAAIFVRISIRVIQFFWLRYVVRWTDYDCSLNLDHDGILRHSMGESVIDKKSSNGKVWKYPAKNDVTNKTVKHGGVIHGPYTNDFGKPGYYKARFEVLSIGFSRTNKTLPILQLEVVDSRPEYISTDAEGKEKWITRTTEIGQRLLTEANLSKSKRYQKYDITFYSNGNGRYEYRAAIFEKAWPQGRELYFDRIRIRPWMFIREVFA